MVMEAFESLLNNAKALTPEDLSTLNTLLVDVNTGTPDQRRSSNNILVQFQESRKAFDSVSLVLTTDQASLEAKFFSLNVLIGVIERRWRDLTDDQRTNVRQFILEAMVHFSQDSGTPDFLLQKINACLADVVRLEWPHTWTNAIETLANAAELGERVCLNVFQVMTNVLEAVFSETGKMTLGHREKLAEAVQTAFPEMLQLCSNVIKLGDTVDPVLIRGALRCLQTFLSYVEPAALLQTDILKDVGLFLNNNNFTNEALRVALEVMQIRARTEQHAECQLVLAQRVLDITRAAPEKSRQYEVPGAVHPQSVSHWEEFWFGTTLVLTEALKGPCRVASGSMTSWVLQREVIPMLVEMGDIPHDEGFKVLLEFWTGWLGHVKVAQKKWLEMSEEQRIYSDPTAMAEARIAQARGVGRVYNLQSRAMKPGDPMVGDVARTFNDQLSRLIALLIRRMLKPPEVLVQYDLESGTVERAFEMDSDELRIGRLQTDCLRLLATIASDTMLDVLEQRLDDFTREDSKSQRAERNWNPMAFNRLCWSVGAIAGCLAPAKEKAFVVKLITKLIWLCENKTGKENKAVVAASIMFICGRYDRVLRRHFAFCEAVVSKIYQFLADTFPGVQEMACDTLYKICSRLKVDISKSRSTEEKRNLPGDSLLEWMLGRSDELANQMRTKRNSVLYYKSLGAAVSGIPDEGVQSEAIRVLLGTPTKRFEQLYTTKESFYEGPEHARSLVAVFQSMVAVCEEVGAPFHAIIEHIYAPMLELYKLFSKRISDELATRGLAAAGHEDIRQLRLCKKETLRLIGTFFSSVCQRGKGKNVEQVIIRDYYPPVMDSILQSYLDAPATAKDCEVLDFLTMAATDLASHFCALLPQVFHYVFDSTLELISSDRHAYMDHRVAFFNLLDSCTRYSQDGILALEAHQCLKFVQCLAFGFSHEQPMICEKSLTTTFNFLSSLLEDGLKNNGVDNFRESLKGFFKQTYFPLLGEVMNCTTDTMHRSGLELQSKILLVMFSVLTRGVVDDEASKLTIHGLREWLMRTITSVFPNMPGDLVNTYIHRWMDMTTPMSADQNSIFQEALQDFLIDASVSHGVATTA